MDEFAIDLDQVLDEFEKSEGANVSHGDVFRPHHIITEMTETEENLSSNFPHFEALDLDLAEADFAPSCWNYDTSADTKDVGSNDAQVGKRESDKNGENVPVDFPGVFEPGESINPTSLENEPANSMSARVDVLSECLHTLPQVQDSLTSGHQGSDTILTSPPDIMFSAPDVISSAIVGVDVVPSPCTAVSPINSLNQKNNKMHREMINESDPVIENLEASVPRNMDIISNGKNDAEMGTPDDLPEFSSPQLKSSIVEGISGSETLEISTTCDVNNFVESSTIVINTSAVSVSVVDDTKSASIYESASGVTVEEMNVNVEMQLNNDIIPSDENTKINLEASDSSSFFQYSTSSASSSHNVNTKLSNESPAEHGCSDEGIGETVEAGVRTEPAQEMECVVADVISLEITQEQILLENPKMLNYGPVCKGSGAHMFDDVDSKEVDGHEVQPHFVNISDTVGASDVHDDQNDTEVTKEMTENKEESVTYLEDNLKNIAEETIEENMKKGKYKRSINLSNHDDVSDVSKEEVTVIGMPDEAKTNEEAAEMSEVEKEDEELLRYTHGFDVNSDKKELETIEDANAEELESSLSEGDGLQTQFEEQTLSGNGTDIVNNARDESAEFVSFSFLSDDQKAKSKVQVEITSDSFPESANLDETTRFDGTDEKLLVSDGAEKFYEVPRTESFTLINSNDADTVCEVSAKEDYYSQPLPVLFENLINDDQMQCLMREVEEEMKEMMVEKSVPEEAYEKTDLVTDCVSTDQNPSESLEDKALLMENEKNPKEGQNKLFEKITSSDIAATKPLMSDNREADTVGISSSVQKELSDSADSDIPSIPSLPSPVISTSCSEIEVSSGMQSQSNKNGYLIPSNENEEQYSGVATIEQQMPDATVKSSGIVKTNQPSAISNTASEEAGTSFSGVQSSALSPLGTALTVPSIPMCSNINLEITQLGKVAPVWLPDAEASACMGCASPFSFTRRRHHCRACGKVFCHACSSLKTGLLYLDNKQDRVCSKCYQDLVRASFYERAHPDLTARTSTNDSSTASGAHALAKAEPQLPSASAPAGVLRKQGSVKGPSEGKQVMFSDGIRPGGDLTDLDGSSETRPTTSRRSRKTDKAAVPSIAPPKNLPDIKRANSLIPSVGLPPVVATSSSDLSSKDSLSEEMIFQQLKSVENSCPVTFAINKDLVVMVKIIKLDCCVGRLCWCFTTKGLCTVGQDEVIIILECLPEETTIPIDIMQHLNVLYDTASHGNTVSNLDHTVLPSGSLGSPDVSGILYVRQTFQCLQKIILPDPPYLFGLLLQKSEMAWAKVFPLRLMLRLGAEFRYYPCPLVSVRNRRPVYGEIGHTIMNLLADFHNYQYMVPRVSGLIIHMEDKRTTVSIPQNRFSVLMKILSNSDDHVIALGASFSTAADSHLVCLQNEDGNYQTQAINIQHRPRRVTGAGFIVFNGALKATSGLRAKSSIVEDGLMVQITSDAMTDLKQALSQQRNYTILCGSLEIAQPDEMVVIEWTSDEKSINAGVKSPIDGLSMYGVDSIRIHGFTDFAKEELAIRWTEVFILSSGTCDGAQSEAAADFSNLAESLAQACCQALVSHLHQLAFEMLTKIGLRVTIDSEQVGYEIGSRCVRLPDVCMNSLDEKLIPIIHGVVLPRARSGPVILELIFHILVPNAASASSGPAK